MIATDVPTDLLAQVEGIRSLIREHAPGAEANRQLSSVVYDAMYESGLFAMLAPKKYGGLESHPVDAMRVWVLAACVGEAGKAGFGDAL